MTERRDPDAIDVTREEHDEVLDFMARFERRMTWWVRSAVACLVVFAIVTTWSLNETDDASQDAGTAAADAQSAADVAEQTAAENRLGYCKLARLITYVPATQFPGEPDSNFIGWIQSRRSLLLVIRHINACSTSTTRLLATRVREDNAQLRELGVEPGRRGGGRDDARGDGPSARGGGPDSAPQGNGQPGGSNAPDLPPIQLPPLPPVGPQPPQQNPPPAPTAPLDDLQDQVQETVCDLWNDVMPPEIDDPLAPILCS